MSKDTEDGIHTVLLLSQLQHGSGNNSTISRIRCHFEGSPWRPVLVDTESISCTDDLSNLVETNKSEFAVGLHAYHAGKWLKDSGCPYGLIFGGTDLNEYFKDSSKLNVMKQAVNMARFLVAFSEHMSNQSEALWPGCRMDDKLKVIPQGVLTSVPPHVQVRMHERYGLPIDCDIVVLVGALRPVKDQLYLLDAFSDWYQASDRSVYLAIIGPLMDEEYGRKVLNKVKSCQGVLYMGSHSLQDTHCLIQKSVALINCSLSEGQPTAVLEAQMMRTPVIVRDIPGNVAIVRHGQTGLVFTSTQDFIHQLECLLEDDSLQGHLVNNAAAYVDATHSYLAEKNAYLQLMSEMKKSLPPHT